MNWATKAREFVNDTRSMFFRPKHLSRFEYGAQWQREQLRTAEAIERTAEALWSTSDKRTSEDWAHEGSEIRKYFIDSVEEFSTALLGED